MFSIERVLYRMGEGKWQTSVPLSRYIWNCRSRRARAEHGTKGRPIRARKRFVGEFAHASRRGTPCPARAWNKRLPYRTGKGNSPLSRIQSIKQNHHCKRQRLHMYQLNPRVLHHCKSQRLHMCPAHIRESWCMYRRCIWGIPIEETFANSTGL